MSNQKASKCTWRNFMSPQQNKFLTFGTDLSNNKHRNSNETSKDSNSNFGTKSGNKNRMRHIQQSNSNRKKVNEIGIQEQDERDSQTSRNKGFAINFESMAYKEFNRSPVFKIYDKNNQTSEQALHRPKDQQASNDSLSDLIEKQVIATEQYPARNQRQAFYLENNLKQRNDYPNYFSYQNNGVVFYDENATSPNERDAQFSQKRTVSRSMNLISKKISQELSSTIQELCSVNKQQLLTQKKIVKMLGTQRFERILTNSRSLLKRKEASRKKTQNRSKSSNKVSTIKKKVQNEQTSKSKQNNWAIMNHTTTKKKEQKLQNHLINQKIKQLEKLKSDLQGMLTKKTKTNKKQSKTKQKQSKILTGKTN